ncbi:hypothetical protein [Cryobacterium sp. GrIS_2_6]|uniref:hypothetical protein n=1 Tax=Cryobacterium sp. GrIS_2_6 TaxID=3162785 RepID=UPI002E0C972B|nr:hypothetical protein [Cryobacterium psychrotolerans]MEC5149215.1 hypothetical protein [Cryobacterium psychrotolerans]MEC5149296.1 hypothetical protein [Cryobacterium psychrotolerans]
MAIQLVPFALQNASHSAALFRQSASAGWSTAGVIGLGELSVTAQSTPNMSVQISAGRAKVLGSSIAPPSGFTFTTQGFYDVLNDAAATVTVAAADATNPRIDVAYVQVQDSYYAGATNQAVLGVVTGTPATSPVAPATPSNALALGTIAVAANATVIVAGNVARVAAMAIPTPTPASVNSGGLTLVKPTSVSGAGSPTVSALGTVTFSATTAVGINGCFSALYDNYCVLLNVTSASAPDDVAVRVSAAGVAQSAANYVRAAAAMVSVSPSYTYTSGATFTAIGRVATSGGDIKAEILSPFNMRPTRLTASAMDGDGYYEQLGGSHNAAFSADGLTLFALAGSTLAGTARIYGYNNG